MSDTYTRDFERVRKAEAKRIASQRKKRGARGAPLTGLAISGGGIRSASFALGVLQGLFRGKLLDRIDYLSTVSGGGYIGSALTWFRRDGSNRWPFGKRGTGARTGDHDDATEILSYLRQHGRYLTPAGGGGHDQKGKERAVRGVQMIAFLGQVLRATALSVLVYGSLLIGVFVVIQMLNRFVDLIKPVLGALYFSEAWNTFVGSLDFASMTGFVLLAIIAISFVISPFTSWFLWWRISRNPGNDPLANRPYLFNLRAQQIDGRLLQLALVAFVLASVPIASDAVSEWLSGELARGAAAVVSMIIGAALALSRFARMTDESVSLGPIWEWVRTIGAATLIGYGLLVLAHAFTIGLLDSGRLLTIPALVLLGLLVGLFVDLNRVGIGRMYRARLMETFLPDDSALRNNQWQPATEANVAPLSAMSPEDGHGPYHLLNTNIITPGSPHARFRGREGDSFVLSPLYSGSDATGWRATDTWMGGDLTLATAMATSGAAANPNAGSAGSPTRDQVVSAVMRVLGLRLGFWAQNPDEKRFVPPWVSPNYLYPGMLPTSSISEDRPFVELSDGGHFENLGIYELVRRRLPVIIAIDGSCDPDFEFESLGNAIERIRVDFGTEIRFHRDLGLADVLPESEGESAFADRYAMATRGFAVADIRYPAHGDTPAERGVLLYVKATLVPGVPTDVLAFRSAHTSFPHETTADQFFSESHVEAYRALGERIARTLVKKNGASQERKPRGKGGKKKGKAKHRPGLWL